MIGSMLRSSAGAALTVRLSVGGTTDGQAQQLEKVTVGGWSQPISEITNLLAEPDKGFFKAKGVDLGYVPGSGGGDAIRNLLAGTAVFKFERQ